MRGGDAMDDYYDLEAWKLFDGPFPQMVFADNAQGIFSLLVKKRTSGYYGHFMWLIGKNQLASQWFYFQRQALDHYAGAHLTFVADPKWTELDRLTMLTAINNDLAKPWYKTLYDIPGVVGELFGWDWLNLPGFDFCSERGDYLTMVGPTYNLKHPDPQELREWTKRAGNTVTGRYSPD
jgi:hypothetical protein